MNCSLIGKIQSTLHYFTISQRLLWCSLLLLQSEFDLMYSTLIFERVCSPTLTLIITKTHILRLYFFPPN